LSEPPWKRNSNSDRDVLQFEPEGTYADIAESEAQKMQKRTAMIDERVENSMKGTQRHEGEVSFLDVTLHPRSLVELTGLVERGILNRRKWIIAHHNLHSLYLFHRQPRLREFYAGVRWIPIDGMPLIGLGRLYGYDLKREQRVTYVDWMDSLVELIAARGWRIFYLGSPKEVAEKGAVALRGRYSGLQIEVSDGYFDARPGSRENEALLKRINSYAPDLLMVGMGMPRQEFWIQDHFDRLNANVILASGAAIDYIAGAVPTPPRWAGRLGLEWAFRLVNEPRRLFGRYLKEPWYIVTLVLFDIVRKRGKLSTTVHVKKTTDRGRDLPAAPDE
jgi:N-acetylglucosaminyldiphosphoundecaprenol N-acetyl-beta-D-mannosaminyltransferase